MDGQRASRITIRLETTPRRARNPLDLSFHHQSGFGTRAQLLRLARPLTLQLATHEHHLPRPVKQAERPCQAEVCPPMVTFGAQLCHFEPSFVSDLVFLELASSGLGCRLKECLVSAPVSWRHSFIDRQGDLEPMTAKIERQVSLLLEHARIRG